MSTWTIYIILIVIWTLFVIECQGFRRLGRMITRAKRLERELLPSYRPGKKNKPANGVPEEVYRGDEDRLPGISIVIPVKNQYELLQRNLPMFLTQDYPNYEVWVVDMTSSDETRWLLESMEDSYKNLHHTFTQPTALVISEPRLALTLGIRAASYDWVMLSRIDCFPKSNQWLRMMGREAERSSKTKIVAGYTRYDKPSSRWSGLRLRFLRTWQQMLMLPYSRGHRLYMADGTNVMYRKSLFMKYHGFARNEKLMVGALEILVNRHSTRSNTTTCMHPNAIMTQQIPGESHLWRESRVMNIEIQRHFKHWVKYRVMYTYHAILPWVFAFWWYRTWTHCWGIMQWGMLTGTALMLLIIVLMSIRCFNSTLVRLGERPMFFRLPILLLLVPYWDLEALVFYLFSNKKKFYKPLQVVRPKDDVMEL